MRRERRFRRSLVMRLCDTANPEIPIHRRKSYSHSRDAFGRMVTVSICIAAIHFIVYTVVSFSVQVSEMFCNVMNLIERQKQPNFQSLIESSKRTSLFRSRNDNSLKNRCLDKLPGEPEKSSLF